MLKWHEWVEIRIRAWLYRYRLNPRYYHAKWVRNVVVAIMWFVSLIAAGMARAALMNRDNPLVAAKLLTGAFAIGLIVWLFALLWNSQINKKGRL
jgi:hypothetical protein